MWSDARCDVRRRAEAAGPRILVLLVLLVCVACAETVDAQQLTVHRESVPPPASSSAEIQLELLRGALLDWSRGRVIPTEQAKKVYSAKADPRSSAVTACIRSVEEDLSNHLEDRDPTLLPILAVWHAQMLLEAIDWAGQPTLRSADVDRIEDRLTNYRRRAARRVKSLSRAEADRNALLVWTGLSELFSRYGSRSFNLLARTFLDHALEIDEEFLPARYLHGWVGEKVLPSHETMRPWRELMEDYPDKAEYGLRFGMNAAAAGRRVKAIEQLQRVARSDGAEWVRALAYETWAQLLLDPERGGSSDQAGAAREILREAQAELSPWPNLDLLVSYLDLKDRRDAALRLAERVEAHVWPEDMMAPQLLYELPNLDELTVLRTDLTGLLQSSQRNLLGHLEELDGDAVLRRQSLRDCR